MKGKSEKKKRRDNLEGGGQLSKKSDDHELGGKLSDAQKNGKKGIWGKLEGGRGRRELETPKWSTMQGSFCGGRTGDDQSKGK